MLGAFVYLGDRAGEVAEGHARFFARYPWHRASSFADERVVVSTFWNDGGVANPLHVEDGRVVFLQGFLFADDRLVHRAADLAPLLDAGRMPAGVQTGQFVAGVVDLREGALRAWTDRFGALNAYLHARGAETFLSGRVDAVAALARERPARDRKAVLDVLTAGYVLGLGTPYEGVTLLPHAADVSATAGRAEARSWWTPRYAYRGDETIDERADALHAALARAMRRIGRLPGAERAVLGVSGGLDSRTVLALAEPRPDTFTFGAPDSDERRYAREVVRIAGAAERHREFELDPAMVADTFDEALGLLDGTAAVTNGQIPHLLKRLRGEGYRLIPDSFLGDALLGGSYVSGPKRDLLGAAGDVLRGWRETPYTDASPGAVRDALARALLWETPPDVRSRLGAAAERHVRDRAGEIVALARERFPAPPHQEDFLELVQAFFARGRRAVRNASAMAQNFLEIAFPVLDHGVLDEVLATPTRHRTYRRVYKRIHRRHFPAFDRVPVTSLDDATVRVGDRVRVARMYALAFLRPRGLAPPVRSYMDPERWLAEDERLRDLVVARAGGRHGWGTMTRLATLRMPLDEAVATARGA